MDPTAIWNWFVTLGIGTILLIVLLFIIIGLLLETLFLYIALKITNSRNTDFGDVFVTALIMALIGWIPCIGCILQWIIISSRHDTGLLKAIGVWLLAGLMPLIIALLIIVFVFFPIFAITLPF